MNEEINVGDVVVLKSGGPKMVVVEFGDYSPHGPEDGVKCEWHDKGPQSGTFSRVALRKGYDGPASVGIV